MNFDTSVPGEDLLTEAARYASAPGDHVEFFEAISAAQLPAHAYCSAWAAWAIAAARVGNVRIVKHIHEQRRYVNGFTLHVQSPVDPEQMVVAAVRSADYDMVAYAVTQWPRTPK